MAFPDVVVVVVVVVGVVVVVVTIVGCCRSGTAVHPSPTRCVHVTLSLLQRHH